MKGMNAGRIKQSLAEIAEGGVPEADLLPPLYEHVQQAQQRMQRARRLRRAFVTSALALAVVIGLFAGVPAVRAQMAAWLQRFGLVVVNQHPSQAPQAPVTPVMQSKPVKITDLMIPLDDVQKQVPFHIPRPAWLPEGVEVIGGFKSAGAYGRSAGDNRPPPVVVKIVCGRPGQFPGANVMIDITHKHEGGGYGVDALGQENVSVNGQPAVYAHGSWQGEIGNMVWNRAHDSGMLTWQDGDFTYVISHYGLGLNREDVIRIAESLQ